MSELSFFFCASKGTDAGGRATRHDLSRIVASLSFILRAFRRRATALIWLISARPPIWRPARPFGMHTLQLQPTQLGDGGGAKV